MAAVFRFPISGTVKTVDGVTQVVDNFDMVFGVGASNSGQRQSVSLTGSAFTAFTAPSSARYLIIIIPSTATQLTLKGVTGDTGVALVGATNNLGKSVAMFPVSSPSVGINNGGSTAVVELIWV